MENFANLVSSVWNQGVFGIDLNNILVAIVILLIFIICVTTANTKKAALKLPLNGGGGEI